MKKGKTSKIQTHNFAKISYGTVDSTNLKSIYLNIQTWIEPTDNYDNYNRIVLNMSRSIKHIIFDSVNRQLFEEKFIVDLDLRSSGITKGKKSFMNLEITLYLNKDDVDFKSKEIKESLKKISNNIIDEVFYDNQYFKFYLTKKGNVNNQIQQIVNL
jgi:hypothetical protein